MNGQMDRRRLMQLILALGASAVMRDEVAVAAGSSCRSSIFGGLDLASIQELGREYLLDRPNGKVLGIVGRILADSANEDEALTGLRSKMLVDFAAGRIVNLSGWLVSETEGCVFAVLSRCEL